MVQFILVWAPSRAAGALLQLYPYTFLLRFSLQASCGNNFLECVKIYNVQAVHMNSVQRPSKNEVGLERDLSCALEDISTIA